jgi:hypothetical protein
MDIGDTIISAVIAAGSWYITNNVVFGVLVFVLSYILYSLKVGLVLTIAIALFAGFILSGMIGYPIKTVDISNIQMPDVSGIQLPQTITGNESSIVTVTTTTIVDSSNSTTTTTLECTEQCCHDSDCESYNGKYEFACVNSKCQQRECEENSDCGIGFHCDDGGCAYGT